MLPKFLNDTIDNFSADKILIWLKELLMFFLKPKRFFKTLLNKSKNDQTSQIIFYTLFAAIFNYLLIDEAEFKENYRFIFFLALFSLFIVLPTIITNLILDKSNLKIGKIFILTYLTWLIFSLPIFTFVRFFINTENYFFLLLSNAFDEIACLYSFFLIWFVIFDKKLKIFFGCLINLLLFNTFLFVFILTIGKIDNSNSGDKIEDPLLKELTETLGKVHIFYGSPELYIEYRILNTNNLMHQMYFLDNDSGLHYFVIDDVDKYEEISKNDSKYLDSISPKLKFNRSKQMVNQLSLYLKTISTYTKFAPCDTCLLKDTTINDLNDTTRNIQRKVFTVDWKYKNPYSLFILQKKELIKGFKFSIYPFYINSGIFYPSLIILKKMDFKLENFSVLFH